MSEARNAPEHVAVKMTEGYAVNWYGVLTNEFDDDETTEIYVREDIHYAAIQQARNDAMREVAHMVWNDEDDGPWEHWGEHRNIVVAQTVSKEISEAILAMIDKED